MNKLLQLINAYVLDDQNPETSYNLGLEYEIMGQTASAICYYMRAAERTPDKLLAYECLIRMGNCFDRQGNRKNTVLVLYKHAICLLPERPEAYYFYSRTQERTGEHVESYTYAHLALNFCNFDSVSLRNSVGYPGKYGLLFEKAISAWWWGKNMECRKMLLTLREDYADVPDEEHKKAIQNNLISLGSGPSEVSHRPYNSSKHSTLRFKFDQSSTINNNFSQCYQDMFVLSALNGKMNGTYLEIGGGDPFNGNNTALLEQKFNWTGASIDFQQRFADAHLEKRKHKTICADALQVDYEKLLSEISVDNVVDFLQLDCEPPDVTYGIMEKIPFNKYKFGVITYEHDHYIDVTNEYRQKSRDFLISKGYELVVANISPTDSAPFEDWWVHPDLVKKEIIELLRSNDKKINQVEEYFHIGE